MAIQFSTTVRNNRLDQIEASTGNSAKLYLYSGSVPANCAAADPAGLLATLTLPSDWMNGASGGTKTLSGGSWTGTASAGGTAISFRVKDNTGTTTHIQGTVGTSGTDLVLDNNVLATSQTINITTFTFTDGNA
jgi:hypothetical protein